MDTGILLLVLVVLTSASLFTIFRELATRKKLDKVKHKVDLSSTTGSWQSPEQRVHFSVAPIEAKTVEDALEEFRQKKALKGSPLEWGESPRPTMETSSEDVSQESETTESLLDTYGWPKGDSSVGSTFEEKFEVAIEEGISSLERQVLHAASNGNIDLLQKLLIDLDRAEEMRGNFED